MILFLLKLILIIVLYSAGEPPWPYAIFKSAFMITCYLRGGARRDYLSRRLRLCGRREEVGWFSTLTPATGTNKTEVSLLLWCCCSCSFSVAVIIVVLLVWCCGGVGVVAGVVLVCCLVLLLLLWWW